MIVKLSIEKMVKKKGKEAGGTWNYSCNFYGWEAETERVVVVTRAQGQGLTALSS